MNWFDEKSTLKTASRQRFKAVKTNQNINANDSIRSIRQFALKAIDGAFTPAGKPAGFAYAQLAA